MIVLRVFSNEDHSEAECTMAKSLAYANSLEVAAGGSLM